MDRSALPPLARIAPMALADGGSPDFTVLRDWLDRASEIADVDVVAAVAEAPAPSGSAVVDALLAAIAEQLCDDRAADRPSWTTVVPALTEVVGAGDAADAGVLAGADATGAGRARARGGRAVAVAGPRLAMTRRITSAGSAVR